MSGNTTKFDQEMEDRVRELASIRKKMSALRKEEAALKEDIMSVLMEDDATTAYTHDGKTLLTLDVASRETVDRARLQAIYPAIYDDVLKQSVVQTIKIEPWVTGK